MGFRGRTRKRYQLPFFSPVTLASRFFVRATLRHRGGGFRDPKPENGLWKAEEEGEGEEELELAAEVVGRTVLFHGIHVDLLDFDLVVIDRVAGRIVLWWFPAKLYGIFLEICDSQLSSQTARFERMV